MKLYLIRHGETEYNIRKQMQGWGEIPLNDAGIAQASQLAQHLPQYPLDHIYSSDLRRTVMTACIAASTTGLPISYLPEFRERNPGDLKDSHYTFDHPFFTDPDFQPPNGESAIDFDSRVRSAFDTLIELEGESGRHIAVVTHGMVCNSFVVQCLGFNPYEQEGFYWPNTALTICDYINGQWKLITLASDEHLDTPSQKDDFQPSK